MTGNGSSLNRVLADTHLENELVPHVPAIKSLDDHASPKTKETVASIELELIRTDADDRLEKLQDVNPGLTDDHLDQIAEVTELWLDSKARQYLRSLVRHHYDNRPDTSSMAIPSDILVGVECIRRDPPPYQPAQEDLSSGPDSRRLLCPGRRS